MGKKVCFEYTGPVPDKDKRFRAIDLGCISSLEYRPKLELMVVEYYDNRVADKFFGVHGDVWNRILDLYMNYEKTITFCENIEPDIIPV